MDLATVLARHLTRAEIIKEKVNGPPPIPSRSHRNSSASGRGKETWKKYNKDFICYVLFCSNGFIQSQIFKNWPIEK